MKPHELGPYQWCLIHQVQKEDGEFTFPAVGNAHAVASWRKLSGQDAEPPFARKAAAADTALVHVRKHRHTHRPAMPTPVS